MRRFSDSFIWAWCAFVPLTALLACGSGDQDPGGEGTGGAVIARGGASGDGGAASGGAPPMAGAAGMGATGTQPPGAICSNDTNCSQTQGKAVCCNSTCTLGDCLTTTFLPCNAAADCAVYGGGKICCEVMTSSETTRFCTKKSACMGRVLP